MNSAVVLLCVLSSVGLLVLYVHVETWVLEERNRKLSQEFARRRAEGWARYFTDPCFGNYWAKLRAGALSKV